MSEVLKQIVTLAVVAVFAFTASTPVMGQEGSRYDPQTQLETTVTPTPTPPINIEKPVRTPEAAVEDAQQVPDLLASPVINIWNSEGLRFGHNGNPQRQINILGNVYDTDGNMDTLSYKLNNEPTVTIPVGPDGDRLEYEGDFNVAINTSLLRDGENTVLLTARDARGAETTRTIYFNYTSGRTWQFPYWTNWDSADYIHDQAQIVDGNWRFDTSAGYRGVRPQSTNIGYDRLIAIGGMDTWSDYEVTVPITVWDNPLDGVGGVGVIVNWKGHTGGGVLPEDWHEMGAYAYYSYRNDGRLAMWLNQSENLVSTAKPPDNFQIEPGKTYLFKIRAERITGGGRYSLKAWENNQPEPAWNSPQFAGVYNIEDTNGDQTSGSILLVAHYVDATFGNVTISPIASEPLDLDFSTYLPIIIR